jgi:hypothetical protein
MGGDERRAQSATVGATQFHPLCGKQRETLGDDSARLVGAQHAARMETTA